MQSGDMRQFLSRRKEGLAPSETHASVPARRAGGKYMAGSVYVRRRHSKIYENGYVYPCRPHPLGNNLG